MVFKLDRVIGHCPKRRYTKRHFSKRYYPEGNYPELDTIQNVYCFFMELKGFLALPTDCNILMNFKFSKTFEFEAKS